VGAIKSWDKQVIRKDIQDAKFGGREIRNCPVCNAPVEILRRADGSADRYEPILIESDDILATQDEKTAYWLRQHRKGKKSVAIVGMSPASAGLAPYKEQGIEIWGLNEAHLYNFMPRWDRWFQMHKTDYLLKNESLKGREGHLPWLKEKHDKPIYTLFKHDFIPDAVEYPLIDVSTKLIQHGWRGHKQIHKYFNSSFSYMFALALYEGFEWIEIYGFEMDMTAEYWHQRSCAEYWFGVAEGRGVGYYLPERSRLCLGILYGYNGTDYNRVPEPTEGD
jgi:hypothetical protein